MTESWIARTAAVVSTKTGGLVVAVVAAYAALKLGLIPDDLQAEVMGGLGLAIVMALRAAIAKAQAAASAPPVVETPTLTYSSGSLTSTEAAKRLERGHVHALGLALLVAGFLSACVTVQSRDELTISQTRETADRLERVRGYVAEALTKAKADPKAMAGIDAILEAEVKRVRELTTYEEEKR